MTSIDRDTKAEIERLVRQILRMTRNDAQAKRESGGHMSTLDLSAERLGERLKQGYKIQIVVTNA